MSENKQPTDARYPLRLPADLYEQIRRIAETENRSVNAQIVTLIQEALARRAELRSVSDLSS